MISESSRVLSQVVYDLHHVMKVFSFTYSYAYIYPRMKHFVSRKRIDFLIISTGEVDSMHILTHLSEKMLQVTFRRTVWRVKLISLDNRSIFIIIFRVFKVCFTPGGIFKAQKLREWSKKFWPSFLYRQKKFCLQESKLPPTFSHLKHSINVILHSLWRSPFWNDSAISLLSAP